MINDFYKAWGQVDFPAAKPGVCVCAGQLLMVGY